MGQSIFETSWRGQLQVEDLMESKEWMDEVKKAG